MWSHPGKQLLFMGSEFGQEAEWSESRSLDWWLLDTPWHQGLHRMVSTMNAVYKDRPELWSDDFTPEGFQWIDGADNLRNLISFVRWSKDRKPLVAVCNFSGSRLRGLPRRPAAARCVAGGPQHRRRGVRRLGGREHRHPAG